MSTPPIPEWCEAAPDATFSAPVNCATRAEKFERRIRLRNLIEYAAGAFVVVVFGGMMLGALAKGEWLIAISSLLIIAGAVFIMRNLHLRASNLERRPEDPCLVHLTRQYRRQYEALRSVPKWYLAPLIPGIVMFYAVVTAKVADRIGWLNAIEGVAAPAAFTIGLFALIALANWWGARVLERKITSLEALA